MKVRVRLREVVAWLATRPELVAFVLASSVYLTLIAPGVLWMDVGELSAAAFHLGGAHPPGHPGYTLLGKLACLIPIGEVATRLSMMSAFCAGAALAGVVRLVRVFFSRDRVMGLLVCLPVGMTPAFAINATRPEVYTPTFALLVWAMVFALRFVRESPHYSRHALCSVFLIALAAAIHPAIAAAVGLPVALGLLFVAGRRAVLLMPAAVALIGLASFTYLYLPVRALARTAPPLIWGDPSTWDNFWNLITARVYQSNFAGLSLAERVADRFSLLCEGPGFALCLVGLAGLGFAALTRLRGAGMLLAVLFSLVLAGSLQSSFNPDMRAYLALGHVALALGLVMMAMAALRMLPLPMRPGVEEPGSASMNPAWASAVAILPALLLSLWMPTPPSAERDQSDDAMQLWDETIALMPPGPGIFFAGGDHALFVGQYERLVAGARPDIAVVSAELTRDLWFLKHLRAVLPDLYVPYIDDGQKGQIGERLYWENVHRGRPVWADSLRPQPVDALAHGRAFEFLAAKGSASSRGAPSPPLAFDGFVGRKVAWLTALRRARFEISEGRLGYAAAALGMQDRFPPESLSASAVNHSLYEHLPHVTPRFLFAGFEAELLADDLYWQLDLEVPRRNLTTAEERTHLGWRVLLAGDTERAEAILALVGDPARATTTPMLVAIGRPDLAEQRLRAQIADNPEDADSLALLGSLLGNQKDLVGIVEAEELFERAARLDPENTETWARLGLVYVKQGKTAEAREAWQTGLRLDPGRTDLAGYLRRLDSEAR